MTAAWRSDCVARGTLVGAVAAHSAKEQVSLTRPSTKLPWRQCSDWCECSKFVAQDFLPEISCGLAPPRFGLTATLNFKSTRGLGALTY